MISLQSIAIAVAAAFVIGLGGGSWMAWSLTADYYQAVEAKRVSVQSKEVLKLTEKVLQTERKNDETTGKLNKLALDFTAKRDADAATISGLLRTNRWLRSPVVCEATTGASPAASGSSADTATEGYLSEEFRRELASILARADEAAAYAEVAHEYALKIEQQRQRLSKENK